MYAPSSLWTEVSVALPLMSQRAMSMPLMARVDVPRLPHELGLPHRVPQAFVVERVLPDDELLHVVEGPHRHIVGHMLTAHVAVAGDALVGLQLDEVQRDRGVGVTCRCGWARAGPSGISP